MTDASTPVDRLALARRLKDRALFQPNLPHQYRLSALRHAYSLEALYLHRRYVREARATGDVKPGAGYYLLIDTPGPFSPLRELLVFLDESIRYTNHPQMISEIETVIAYLCERDEEFMRQQLEELISED